MTKPILCLDFDGVIHSYTSGWKGADVIPDPPVPGAFKFIIAAAEYFRIAIYSSRSGQPGGIDAMKAWITKWVSSDEFGIWDYPDLVTFIEWPTEKPAAFITIDDRAIQFNGDWSFFDPKAFLDFKPWNKR